MIITLTTATIMITITIKIEVMLAETVMMIIMMKI